MKPYIFSIATRVKGGLETDLGMVMAISEDAAKLWAYREAIKKYGNLPGNRCNVVVCPVPEEVGYAGGVFKFAGTFHPNTEEGG